VQTCVVQWFQGYSKTILAHHFVSLNLDGLMIYKSFICEKIKIMVFTENEFQPQKKLIDILVS
jgi:hypothetical protein